MQAGQTPGYDPWSGTKALTNALYQFAHTEQANRALAQRDRALDQQQQQADFTQERQSADDALKFIQAKMDVGTQILPGVQKQNYRDFYRWSTEQPLDPKRGLGLIPRELLPSPEQVDQMDLNQFEGMKRNMFRTGKQLADMELSAFKAELERGLIEARGKVDQQRLTQQAGIEAQRFSRDQALAGQREQLQQQELAGRQRLLTQEAELSEARHRNAMELEGARAAGKTAGGLTPAQLNTERQRMRSQISRLWGYNEFSKLDDDAAQNIEEATLRASRYWEDGEEFDAAISRANQEVRMKKAFKAFPQAIPGVMGNKRQTQNKVQDLMNAGIGREQAEAILKQKGWSDSDAKDILDRAGLYVKPEQAPAAGKRFSATATNPTTGERVGYDQESGKWVPIR